MRLLLILLALVLPTAAIAAEWDRYENARFGYRIDIPPGFAGGGEADNGDGQVFRSRDGLLRVYGGNSLESTFAESIRTAMSFATEAGWTLTYKRVTPAWASYSGTRKRQILYARAIALCGGTQYASFEFEYPQSALEAMNSVVERLVHSLKATGNGAGC